jgi:hypothetical protein
MGHFPQKKASLDKSDADFAPESASHFAGKQPFTLKAPFFRAAPSFDPFGDNKIAYHAQPGTELTTGQPVIDAAISGIRSP